MWGIIPTTCKIMTLTSNTFIGEYQYSLDSKGRINIPAKFRQSLSKDNDNTLVATRGQDPCIWIYPIKEWKKIEDELRKLSSISGIHRTFVRQIARSATPSTCDKQGRIIISPSLLSYAELNKEALILGMINKIEIWNPEILKKFDQQIESQHTDAFDELAEKIIL